MTGRIPRQFIDELINRTDIVDLVASRLDLRRKGSDYWAPCPFHNEKTASFHVVPDRQFYHCFGCGAHGTAVGFLMEYEHLSFLEAVEELARIAGLEVPRSDGDRQDPDLNPLYDVLEQAARFYRHQLRADGIAGPAVEYLKGRGLSGEIAALYGLGYAAPGWDNLLRTLGRDRDTLALLHQTGLIVEQSGKRYDRFRDRIMFPIRDPRGRVTGFGGRVLGDQQPKYLNSPETPLFHKGRQLYGLYEARQALRQLENLLIVEGYMDVIALAQFGIAYAVATLGTATTPEHLQQLFRATPKVTFCFDGDPPGRAAAWKALETGLPLLNASKEIRFLFLPEGEDPDSLVRKEGKEGFEHRLTQATALSDFLFNHLSAEVDMSSLDGRARLAETAKPLLAKLPAGILREMLNARLAQLVGLPPQRLGLQSTGTAPRAHRPDSRQQPADPVRRGIHRAVSLLLQQPWLAQEAARVENAWQGLDRPGIPLLRNLLESARENPNLPTAVLVERWRDTEHFDALKKLATVSLDIPPEDLKESFLGSLRMLNTARHDHEAKQLTQRSSPSQMTREEKERLRRLLQPKSQIRSEQQRED